MHIIEADPVLFQLQFFSYSSSDFYVFRIQIQYFYTVQTRFCASQK